MPLCALQSPGSPGVSRSSSPTTRPSGLPLSSAMTTAPPAPWWTAVPPTGLACTEVQRPSRDGRSDSGPPERRRGHPKGPYRIKIENFLFTVQAACLKTPVILMDGHQPVCPFIVVGHHQLPDISLLDELVKHRLKIVEEREPHLTR